MQSRRLSPSDVSALSVPSEGLVCWSRMQAESGQGLNAIVQRKELERCANDGVFCWGVGNAPNRCVPELARGKADVRAIFSVMKSRPKLIDTSPSTIFVWRSFIDQDGMEQKIPTGSLITSRGESATGTKRNHFALFCRTDMPLVLGDFGSFDHTAYRNVGIVGGAVGPSQVTALLRRVSGERLDGAYRVNLQARLTGAFWARLSNPVRLDVKRQSQLNEISNDRGVPVAEWSSLVAEVRCGDSIDLNSERDQFTLL